jgi:prepilin-type N-terminal cleavage/methylation domain-containing protein/prepilin-type processing-associated H-X9-DG protein
MKYVRNAMTLVELLVVIAIIGVLVGLLLPAVQSARASARSSACKSQMRQIGLAILRYCDNHEGEFPHNVHFKPSGKNQSWVHTLAPYVESVDAIRICPEDPLAEERLAIKATSYVANDYVINDIAASQVTDKVRFLRQVSSTHRTMAAFEISDLVSVAPDAVPDEDIVEHAHASEWFSPLNIQRKRVASKLKGDIQLDRHLGGSNYLFLDAHVETISAAQITDWIDDSINFAEPQ